MTSETEWFHDYCLYCDKQTLGGLYCSQACRLADLEKPESTPASPSSTTRDSDSTWRLTSSSREVASFSTRNSTRFELPPSFNFEKYRASSRLESPPLSPRSAGSQQSQPSQKVTHPTTTQTSTSSYSQSRNRSLNTSSSRSSLSSVTSAGSSTQGLSEHAISQLQDYSNSFDHTRDWKRRVTLGWVIFWFMSPLFLDFAMSLTCYFDFGDACNFSGSIPLIYNTLYSIISWTSHLYLCLLCITRCGVLSTLFSLTCGY
jgi:hypothetical protein